MRHILLFLCLILAGSIAAQSDSTRSNPDSVETKIGKLIDTKDSLLAADTVRYWHKGGKMSLTFAQASFTNWAAGGVNSISAAAAITLNASYKKGRNIWENTLDLAYGLTQQGHTAFRKNEDKIDLMSSYSRNLTDRWFYNATLGAKSQFDNSFNFPDDSTIISHFLAPAYVMVSLGLEYRSADKSFNFLFSPVASKTTIVNNRRLADAGAFGVQEAVRDTAGNIITPGETVRFEAGGFIKISYKKEIFKNVTLQTKAELFSNYLDRPQNIDVNWELAVDMKVNRFLSATLSTQMIYDHDVPVPVQRTENGTTVQGTGPRLQFKEVFGLTLAWKF